MPAIVLGHHLINFDVLDKELRAALPVACDGLSYNAGDGLIVYIRDGEDAESLRPAIAGVIAAHDPAVLSPAQELAARRIAAQGDLNNADFLAVLNAINAATTLAAAKPIMRQLLRLVYRVALAQGLTDASDPES